MGKKNPLNLPFLPSFPDIPSSLLRKGYLGYLFRKVLILQPLHIL